MAESNWWNRKPLWLKGCIVGLLIGFVFWLSMFIYLFIIAGSFSSLSEAISNVSVKYDTTSIILILIFSLLVILVLFGLVWTGIGGLYQYVKTKRRIGDYVGFGFGIGLFIIIFISIFNSLYGRIISESFFLFIRGNRVPIYLVIILATSCLGLIDGVVVKKKSKK